MLERVSELKTAIANYTLHIPNLPVFDENKWNIIKKLSVLRRIFHKTTVSLSKRSSTASNIIPQIKFMMLFIGKVSTNAQFSGLSSMLTALKESANTRFSKYLSDSNMTLATFLDPRYKGNFFSDTNDEASETALVNIQKKLVETFEKRQQAVQAEQEVHKEEEAGASSFRGGTSGGNNSEVENVQLQGNFQEDDLNDLDFG